MLLYQLKKIMSKKDLLFFCRLFDFFKDSLTWGPITAKNMFMCLRICLYIYVYVIILCAYDHIRCIC